MIWIWIYLGIAVLFNVVMFLMWWFEREIEEFFNKDFDPQTFEPQKIGMVFGKQGIPIWACLMWPLFIVAGAAILGGELLVRFGDKLQEMKESRHN